MVQGPLYPFYVQSSLLVLEETLISEALWAAGGSKKKMIVALDLRLWMGWSSLVVGGENDPVPILRTRESCPHYSYDIWQHGWRRDLLSTSCPSRLQTGGGAGHELIRAGVLSLPLTSGCTWRMTPVPHWGNIIEPALMV